MTFCKMIIATTAKFLSKLLRTQNSRVLGARSASFENPAARGVSFRANVSMRPYRKFSWIIRQFERVIKGTIADFEIIQKQTLTSYRLNVGVRFKLQQMAIINIRYFPGNKKKQLSLVDPQPVWTASSEEISQPDRSTKSNSVVHPIFENPAESMSLQCYCRSIISMRYGPFRCTRHDDTNELRFVDYINLLHWRIASPVADWSVYDDALTFVEQQTQYLARRVCTDLYVLGLDVVDVA